MTRFSRGTYIVSAFVLTALAVQAAPAPDRNADIEKSASVQRFLTEYGGETSIDSMGEAIRAASALQEIEVDSLQSEPVVRLRFSMRTEIRASISANGSVFTLDMPDVIVVPDPSTMVLDGNHLISSVTVYLAQVEPHFVTRLEVDLSEAVAYRISGPSDEILVTFTQLNDSPALIDLLDSSRSLIGECAARTDEAFGAFGRTLQRDADQLDEAFTHISQRRAQGNERIRLAREAIIRDDLELVLASMPDDLGASERDDRRQGLDGLQTESNSLSQKFEAAFVARRTSVGRFGEELTGLQMLVASELDRARAEVSRMRVGGDIDAMLGLQDRLSEEIHLRLDEITTLQKRAQRGSALFAAQSDDLMVGFAEIFNQAPANALGQGNTTGSYKATPISAPELDGQLALLDVELRTLRSEHDPVELHLAALDAALKKVKAHDLELTLTDPVQVAALTGDLFRAGQPVAALAVQAPAAPPARRMSFGRGRAPGKRLDVLRPPAGFSKLDPADGRIVLAQAQQDASQVTEAEDVQDAQAGQPETAQTLQSLSDIANLQVTEEDPLQQLVTLDFRGMDISNIVGILAEKAGINIIAGPAVQGAVTFSLRDVTLQQAIESILQSNGLGMIQERGIWRITTYEEAVASRRLRRIVPLLSASAIDIQATLQQVVSGPDAALMSITANETTNVIILAGPLNLINEYEDLIHELDQSEPKIPTLTETVPLNYADPGDLLAIITPRMSEAGQVSADFRSRQLILTDLPKNIELLKELIKDLDKPVKQVGIEAMIVDAILADNADTGIDWVLRLLGTHNTAVGDLSDLTLLSNFNPGVLGAQLAFATLSGDIDFRAAISAEVRSENALLLASPFIVTVENRPARIAIAEEIPYQELTQATTGPPIATTEFKEVGTILEVTPRVTNDNHILIDLDAKQSDTKGESVTGVPPEDKREMTTTLLLRDGQTIFIGGLRRFDDELTVRKTPILGDIPILNLLFRNQAVVHENLELMIFLTCNVLGEDVPDLTPRQKRKFDELGGRMGAVNGTKALLDGYRKGKPDRTKPFAKWRRKK